MDVVVAGSSGLIGTALVESLAKNGMVRRLVRRPPATPDEFWWDPDRGELDPAALDGADAVVNLAGAGVGDHRWTQEYRRTILGSRVNTTAVLARMLASMANPPGVWVQASAIGYYGDRGATTLTETDAPGTGFLADVVRRWEAATTPARDVVRVACVRTGIVLSPGGGALGRLLPVLRSGLGGSLGPGTQYWSWITLTDEIAAIRHLLVTDVTGPVNLTAPNPATNAEVTAALAAALHRPAMIAVPGFALRIALGGFAEDLLASARVMPQVLTASGFTFAHPTLSEAVDTVAEDSTQPHIG